MLNHPIFLATAPHLLDTTPVGGLVTRRSVTLFFDAWDDENSTHTIARFRVSRRLGRFAGLSLESHLTEDGSRDVRRIQPAD